MEVIQLVATLTAQLNIIKLYNMKPNFSELQRIYGFDRRTIKKYYEGYEGKPKTHNKSSKLDKHYETIKEKLSIRGVTIKGVYEFLLDKDNSIGSYSNFRKYIKSKELKPSKPVKGHPRYETAPGVQAQVDWKEDLSLTSKNGTVFTFNVLNYKLGNSRYCHFTYKKTKTRQDVLDCLIEAFKTTGGVPKEILFDNMSSIVDINGNTRHINNKITAFANDFGFKVKLCKPRHSFTKGKVESANKFIEWLLPYEKEFDTEEELVEILRNINNKVNTYPNQTTNVPPVLLFQNEKEYLQSLPNHKVIESYLNYDHHIKVQKDSLITYKGCKYSVPMQYINRYVHIKHIDNMLHIYCNTDLIAMHRVSLNKFNYHKEHYTELLGLSMKNIDDIDDLASSNLSQLDKLL